MKLLMALLPMFVLCGISFAGTPASSDEEVLRFVQSYDNAWNHKDKTVIEQVLAPDYVYFSSKGAVQSRKGLIDELFSPSYNLASAERSEMKVFHTMDTAIVSSRWKGQGTYQGKEFHDDQRCSIVLTHEKQGWIVLSEHCTQIVP